MSGERGVHPDCRNASNPYHECVDYCFKQIAETKARLSQNKTNTAESLPAMSEEMESNLSTIYYRRRLAMQSLKSSEENRKASIASSQPSNAGKVKSIVGGRSRKRLGAQPQDAEKKKSKGPKQKTKSSLSAGMATKSTSPPPFADQIFQQINDIVLKVDPDIGVAEGVGERVELQIEQARAFGENTEVSGSQTKVDPVAPDEIVESYKEVGIQQDAENADNHPAEDTVETDLSNLTGRQKRLFELRLKMNEARKANQTAMVAEKKRMEAPAVSRGVSKEKWLEDRKKKVGRLLDANGLDMKKAYMLDTQEAAELKYKKWEKDPAPFGWDVFNQKTLYNAYKKRTKNVEVDLEEYNKLKEEDPEFYREASSLQYGKAPKISESKIDRMVKELKDRDEKRNSFSRRRKFHEEKDVDSINDRNEHFNKKIERAFGKYTLEIKNNLERGTALPD